MILEMYTQRDRLLDELYELNMRKALAIGSAAFLLGTTPPANGLSTLTPKQVQQEMKKISEEFKVAAGYAWSEVKGQPKDVMDKMIEVIAKILKGYGSDPKKVAQKRFVIYSEPPRWFVEKLWKVYQEVRGEKLMYHSFTPLDESIDITKYVPQAWVSKYWAKGVKPVDIKVYWGFGKERIKVMSFYNLDEIAKVNDGKYPYRFKEKYGHPDSGFYYIYENLSE